MHVQEPFLSSASSTIGTLVLFLRNGSCFCAVQGSCGRRCFDGPEAVVRRGLCDTKSSDEAAAALAAAMVAASSAPAMAEVPTFSVFGFGSGQSDAYSQNDNPINPYSQFSEVGADTVYKARNVDEVARKTKALQAALKRFETTPEYIATKQAQNLKANLLEAGGSLKEDMYYFSGEEGLQGLWKGPSVCSEGWHPGRWWPEQAVGPRSWGTTLQPPDSCWVEGSLQFQVGTLGLRCGVRRGFFPS